MESITKRDYNPLQKNPNVFTYPQSSDINITNAGSKVYFAVCAIMIASSIAFIGMSYRVPRRNRIFHYITASITMTAAIAYFTMGSNLGYAAIPVEFQRSNPKVSGTFREIFYVRYIDWFVTTPLLLLDLLLTAGLPWPTILYTIFLDELMIVTGLVGALVGSEYKWGYYVFANAAFFVVVYNLVFVARRHASAISPLVGRTFLHCGALTIFLWFLYPVAWGLAEGGNVIAPDSEAAFYAVLDVLAKPGFGFLLLWGHRNIDPATLGLHIRDYDDPVAAPGEKHGARNGATHGTAANNDYGVATGTNAGTATTAGNTTGTTV